MFLIAGLPGCLANIRLGCAGLRGKLGIEPNGQNFLAGTCNFMSICSITVAFCKHTLLERTSGDKDIVLCKSGIK